MATSPALTSNTLSSGDEYARREEGDKVTRRAYAYIIFRYFLTGHVDESSSNLLSGNGPQTLHTFILKP